MHQCAVNNHTPHLPLQCTLLPSAESLRHGFDHCFLGAGGGAAVPVLCGKSGRIRALPPLLAAILTIRHPVPHVSACQCCRTACLIFRDVLHMPSPQATTVAGKTCAHLECMQHSSMLPNCDCSLQQKVTFGWFCLVDTAASRKVLQFTWSPSSQCYFLLQWHHRGGSDYGEWPSMHEGNPLCEAIGGSEA